MPDGRSPRSTAAPTMPTIAITAVSTARSPSVDCACARERSADGATPQRSSAPSATGVRSATPTSAVTPIAPPGTAAEMISPAVVTVISVINASAAASAISASRSATCTWARLLANSRSRVSSTRPSASSSGASASWACRTAIVSAIDRRAAGSSRSHRSVRSPSSKVQPHEVALGPSAASQGAVAAAVTATADVVTPSLTAGSWFVCSHSSNGRSTVPAVASST